MPEIKKVFLRGKMNKDLDERLIPDGEYRDASNIQISSTESSDAGTVQNILGNKKISNLGIGGSCVGSIENTETDKIYLFIKGTSVNAIVEYNESTDVFRPVLIDNRSSKILNFIGNKITGITIIQNFLVFTDNESEPKILDVSDTSPFITGSIDYNTTTRINNQPFIESDITLIKKKPHNAPKVKFHYNGSGAVNSNPRYKEKFVRFAYRWKFTNGQYSALSPFSEPAFLPSTATNYDLSEGVNNQMLNNITGAFLYNMECGNGANGADIINNIEYLDILYKESNNTNIYLYSSITKSEALDAYSGGYSVYNEVKKSILPENQLLRAYDNVPFKAKAVDIVGNRIVFGNYKDGLDVEGFVPSFQQANVAARTYIEDEEVRKVFNAQGNLISGATSVTNNSVPDMAAIKRGRTYEIGIVFEDEYGRQTPVITGSGSQNEGTLTLAHNTGNEFGSKFKIQMAGTPPTGNNRITRFKYYIKPSSNKFYNIAIKDIKNDLEDSSTVWLVVPSYEINKVKEGQFLQLKKALNTSAIINYNNQPDNFKFKILDISSETPENIDATESFDGKFFIKIKKTAEITENLIQNAGSTGGNNSNINEFIQVDVAPSNALFLGQVEEPHEDRYNSYYFKDGEIYEVERTIPSGVTINPTFTTANGLSFTTSKEGVSGYADLSQANNYTNFSGTYEDTTGATNATINGIFVKVASGNFPSDFYIEYSTSNQDSSSNNITPNSSPAVFETIPEDEVLDIFYETSESFPITAWGSIQYLNWHNCYQLGNGVESSTIRDDFNEDTIDPGVKVSTQILQEYTERTQQSSLIYSGIFNSETNINNLNQFNTALKITKELNPEYGSIQKLHARDTDLIALCEDKILRVLANKDALFNADGNVNLTATENVLGQAVAYNGEYGISKNPESFASHGYRAYFTDKARGAVIRLSRDGLTVISDKGMTSFFRENLLDESNDIVGSYDIYSDQYILTLPSISSSISFKENVDGWVSRLSFVPEGGVSLNGNYYTCKNGEMYLHHSDGSQRNTFYGIFGKSGIQLIFNQEPSAIKNFKTISYEGTENWITDLTGTDIIRTDQQEGEIIEFKEKEGKYYGLISGIETQLDTISSTELNTRLKDFSIQGLGNISSTSGANIFTCNDAGFSIINGATGDSSLTKSSVSLGTLVSVSPSTLQSGSAQYTASIRVPNGYTNTGATITCTDNATGTDTDIEFTAAIANLQINDGTVGDTVTGTVDAGTIASISPSVYSQGTATYTATINIPASGYTNSGTITATDTATGTFGSCGFSLSVGAYSSGGTTLTGTFTGTDFGSNPTINLTVDSGTISPTSTTKSALTSGLAITVNQAANITATIASGLCSQEPATATIQAPQASTVAISGIGTEYVYQSITLTANVTGSVSSYQWYKDTNSGFTPSSSNIISGATSATLSTTETAADTIYYKVKIDGTTDSADHIVIWTAYTVHTNLKYLAGVSANNLACTSTTPRTIYSNGTFTGATNFYVNPQGSSSGFAAGTYSDGTNYRFINSGGIPSSSIGCPTSSGQQIQASSCRNSNDIHYFDVDLNGNSSLSNGDIISFTSQVEGNTYWVVDNSNYTGSSFDATPTLSSTHSSCLVADPPTLDLAASAEVFVNANVSLNAQPQFTPQGATFTYVYQKSTDGGSSFSTIQTTTNANITDTAPSSATTNLRYKVSIQGTSIESGVKTTNVSAYYPHTLKFVSTGSNSNTACTVTGSSNEKNVFANINYIAGTITQLYTSATGGTSGFAAGTYSDGNIHGYFNSNGQLQGSWVQCPAPASGSVEIFYNNSASDVTDANPFATVTLNAVTSNISNITGYQWTENNSNVGTNSGYGASLTTTEKNNIGLGSITKTYGVTVSGDGTTFNDTIEVTWQGVSQTVAVVPCVGSGTKYARITNSSSWPVNTVLNFTGGGGVIPDGCYKITNNNYGGAHDASVQVAGGYPFSFTTSCCTCSGCSASISGSSTGTQGTGETLTANATGITPSGYTWFVSYTHPTNGPWTEITSQTSQTSLWNVTSAGTVYYKVTISGYNASDSNATLDAYHTITWSASQTPVARTYQLRELDSTTCGISDAVAYGNYTSINALGSNTVVTLQGNTTQCYSVVGYISSYNSSYSAINAEYPSCTNCYSIINQDCSFTLNAGNTYNGSNGTALFTANIGTSASSTDTISLVATDGSTVSPTSTTVGALESGLNVTIGQGKTLRATITSGTCNNTSQTAQAPSLNCQSVTLYYSTNNPASNAAAKNDLCGLGNTRSFRLNAGSLALATQLYTDSSCSTLESGTKYFSENNIEYYVWNGSSFSNGTPLNCSSGGNIQ